MAVNIGPQIGLNGEAAYTKSLKNIIAQSKALQAEMKAVTSAFDANDSSQKKLESQINVLNKQIETQQQRVKLLGDAYTQSSDKVDKLNQELQDAVSKYGATSTEAQKAANALDKQQQAAQRARTEYLNATTALNRMQSQMGELTGKVNQVRTPLEKLTDTIGSQQRELDDLKTQYANAVLEFGKGSNSANRLQGEIEELSNDLRTNKQRLAEVTGQVDDLGDRFNTAGQQAADFGDVLSAGTIIEGAKGIIDAIGQTIDEVSEYRKIMGSLEVSSEKAGYAADATSEAYYQLYWALGDDQTAATALANLQALKLEQGDLMNMIDLATGAWATYGDSIPIDGLAESVNETIRTGTVTGTFADVLNWGSKEGETFGVMLKENTEANKEWNDAVNDAVTAEDYFNLALQNASSQQERANLVAQAMASQGLAETADAWYQNNKDIVNANDAQLQFSENAATLAERVAPAVNAVKVGFNDLFTAALQMTEGIDFRAVADAISAGFAFVIENKDIIVQDLAAIGAGIAALKLVKLGTDIASIASGAATLTSVFPALGGAVTALTGPFGLVIAAITGAVLVINTFGDQFQQILAQVDSYLQGVFATDWTESFGVLGNVLNGFFAGLKNIWDSIMDIFNGVIDFIRGVFTGDWERAWNGVKEIFSGIFNGLVNNVRVPLNGIIGILNGVISGLNMLIDGLNSISIDIPSWVPGIGGKTFGFNIGHIGSIPYLATGGIVRSGSAIVGEAGPELMTVFGNRTVVQPLPASYSMPSTQASATQDKAIINAITAATRSIVQAVQANGGEIVIGDDVIYRSYNRERASRAIVTGGAY